MAVAVGGRADGSLVARIRFEAEAHADADELRKLRAENTELRAMLAEVCRRLGVKLPSAEEDVSEDMP